MPKTSQCQQWVSRRTPSGSRNRSDGQRGALDVENCVVLCRQKLGPENRSSRSRPETGRKGKSLHRESVRKKKPEVLEWLQRAKDGEEGRGRNEFHA